MLTEITVFPFDGVDGVAQEKFSAQLFLPPLSSMLVYIFQKKVFKMHATYATGTYFSYLGRIRRRMYHAMEKF